MFMVNRSMKLLIQFPYVRTGLKTLMEINSGKVTWISKEPLGLYSLSGKTSYRQISWSLEAAGLDVAMVVSLWNLTGTSAAALPRYLPNFRTIGKV